MSKVKSVNGMRIVECLLEYDTIGVVDSETLMERIGGNDVPIDLSNKKLLYNAEVIDVGDPGPGIDIHFIASYDNVAFGVGLYYDYFNLMVDALNTKSDVADLTVGCRGTPAVNEGVGAPYWRVRLNATGAPGQTVKVKVQVVINE